MGLGDFLQSEVLIQCLGKGKQVANKTKYILRKKLIGYRTMPSIALDWDVLPKKEALYNKKILLDSQLLLVEIR